MRLHEFLSISSTLLFQNEFTKWKSAKYSFRWTAWRRSFDCATLRCWSSVIFGKRWRWRHLWRMWLFPPDGGGIVNQKIFCTEIDHFEALPSALWRNARWCRPVVLRLWWWSVQRLNSLWWILVWADGAFDKSKYLRVNRPHTKAAIDARYEEALRGALFRCAPCLNRHVNKFMLDRWDRQDDVHYNE